MNLGLGAALDLPGTGLRLVLDANFPRAYYQDVRAGAEWRWHDLLALRAGYRRELDVPGAPTSVTTAAPVFVHARGTVGVRWVGPGVVDVVPSARLVQISEIGT
jgi:hypothetical protein